MLHQGLPLFGGRALPGLALWQHSCSREHKLTKAVLSSPAAVSATWRLAKHPPEKSSVWRKRLGFTWVWPKIKQEGLRRFWSMFLLTRVPFWHRFFEPQPLAGHGWQARMTEQAPEGPIVSPGSDLSGL